MAAELEALQKTMIEELSQTSKSSEVEQLKVKYLGRKGPIQELMKLLKDASADERPAIGKAINDLKVLAEASFEERLTEFSKHELKDRLSEESIDVTLPGNARNIGSKHLISQAMEEMLDILVEMGFSIQYGPDIESDYYNFESLNFPPDHPARDMQDTFYLDDKTLLRTHTTNVQSRFLETERPPIRVAAPGIAYRNETITARSHVFFHQVDIFYVDKDVSFADLQATKKEFLNRLFKTTVETRFRPSYFPFTEPSLEVDIRCLSCLGAGCQLCKHTGWLEVAGAGMIHPEVLKNGGIDPEKYSGFAWGMGVARLVMLKSGIKDIRMFTENDMRFLNQFPAV